MPTSVGPNTKGEENLVFAFDQDHFPHGWGLTQSFPDPEMESTTVGFGVGNSFYSGYYLGQYTYPVKDGNTLTFSGGDLSNYYTISASWRGWDNGSIGSTGGNWLSFGSLPTSADTTRDFIVNCKWRFKYVSLTGNGSTNPTFQLGRGYTQLYGRTFAQTGNSYDWQYTKFKINGIDGGGSNTNTAFTFGLSSADSAVEIDHMRVYEINKSTGLKDPAGNNSINLANVNFSTTGKLDFDGTDDYIGCDTQPFSGSRDITFLCWVKSDGALTEARRGIFSAQNTPAGYLSFFGYTGGSNGNILFETRDPVNSTYQGVSSQGFGIYSGNWNMVGFQVKPGHMSVFYANQEDGFYYNESVDTRPGFEFRNFNLGVDSSNFDWNGQIDGVRLFNRALTRAELEAHYKAFKSRYI